MAAWLSIYKYGNEAAKRLAAKAINAWQVNKRPITSRLAPAGAAERLGKRKECFTWHTHARYVG